MRRYATRRLTREARRSMGQRATLFKASLMVRGYSSYHCGASTASSHLPVIAGRIGPFDSGGLTGDLNYSRFVAEQPSNGVLAKEPELGQFRNCVMPFQSYWTETILRIF